MFYIYYFISKKLLKNLRNPASAKRASSIFKWIIDHFRQFKKVQKKIPIKELNFDGDKEI
ncbi:hypothetical protein ACVWYG_002083 [Pedobacter sp. UYEF25]